MLKAIYKCGSSLLLPKPKDIDYLLIYDTKEEASAEAMKKNRVRDGINRHYNYVENVLKVRLYCYTNPILELIEGEEIEGLKTFSIFDKQVKEQYIALLKNYVSWLPHESKLWYHIYIAVKMYDKGKMSLTKTEKNTAQKIHDEGIDEDNYQYIIDYFEKINHN